MILRNKQKIINIILYPHDFFTNLSYPIVRVSILSYCACIQFSRASIMILLCTNPILLCVIPSDLSILTFFCLSYHVYHFVPFQKQVYFISNIQVFCAPYMIIYRTSNVQLYPTFYHINYSILYIKIKLDM